MTSPFAAAPDPARLRAAALAYAARGWHIFPLKPRDKTPLTARGFLEATADAEQVARWWDRWPTANIGMAPGASGLVVLDLDGPDGEAAAARLGLCAEPCLSAKTGRDDGGRHLYFTRPDFAVSNRDLAPKLDVRGDTGYVVVPPSVHPSGALYRWETKQAPGPLPPPALEALRSVQTTDRATAGHALAAADIPALDTIGAGGRNQTLTRYAGRLLAKGHRPDETYDLLLGLNATRCVPPLDVAEVLAIVQSIAGSEARKPERQTTTGQTLRVVDEAPPAEAPDFEADADRQLDEAIARGRMDLSGAPRWAFTDLHVAVGEMLPGDFWIVGALTGNGKTALLMSQMDAFAVARVPTLYLPLEVKPSDMRRRWAAWRLGLDPVAVARNHWHRLPEGAQAEHEQAMAEQRDNPYVRFPDDRRVSLNRLAWWVRHGVEAFGVRIVVIDHFHRLEFGAGGAAYRVQVTDTVRALKDLAVELGIVILSSAQLNQAEQNPLDRYMPPQLRRLKESSGIQEEADVVLMLSRRLRYVVGGEDLQAIRAGLKSERDVADPNTMAVTCRKHRLDDAVAGDRTVLLHVEHGRVTDRASDYIQHWTDDQ